MTDESSLDPKPTDLKKFAAPTPVPHHAGGKDTIGDVLLCPYYIRLIVV
jgi:hypothetical protein